jgi:hypothetical protein
MTDDALDPMTYACEFPEDHDTDEHPPTCIYCGQPFAEMLHAPYCSFICAIDASEVQ